jgi:fatty acid desaturase
VTGQMTAIAGDRPTVAAIAAPTLTQLMMPTSGEIAQARRRAHNKALLIAVLALAAYGGLVVANTGLFMRFVCAAVLIVALVATATSVMHDANHGAFIRSARWNRVLPTAPTS